MIKIWGPPTWIFLHTFIEKMNSSFYIDNTTTILNLIKEICFNLPCVTCMGETDHARSYLENTVSTDVPTKTHMKQFLFNFHNHVNKRLHKPQFTNFNQYQRAKLDNIFKYFSINYSNNTAPFSKRFSPDLTRKQIIKKIRTFLLNNSRHFRW